VAVVAYLLKGTLAVEFFLQTTQGFINGFTFFDFKFAQ